MVMVEVDPDQGITIPKFKVIPLGQKLATPVSSGASQVSTDSPLATHGMTNCAPGDVCVDMGQYP
jgi:hypothetical protein